MDQQKLGRIALGASIAALLLAITTGRLPRWLRIVLVLALVVVAGATGLLAYRVASQPHILTVAVGTLDGEAARMMSSIASRLASNNSGIRLKVVEKASALGALEAFKSGQAKLAIIRPDIGNPSAARAVAVITKGTLLIVVPPGSAIKSVGDLYGKAVGVVGGEANRQLTQLLDREYDLTRAKTNFVPIELKDITQALQSKRISALLVVMPISEKYLTILRTLVPSKGKQHLGVIPIDSAGAIAGIARYYESYDLPKAAIRGSPPIPDDDLPTLRVPFYLIADKTLADLTVAALAKAIMETRSDLLGEFPLLSQISTPETDKDAYVPIHPGAAAYFNGDEKTVLDRYGDYLFYGSMLLGGLASLLAAIWKFLVGEQAQPQLRPLNRLFALIERVDGANSDSELIEIEKCVDEILGEELEKHGDSEGESRQFAALSLATHRIEQAILRRRGLLNSGTIGASPGGVEIRG